MTRFMPVGFPGLLHPDVLSGGELIHTIVIRIGHEIVNRILPTIVLTFIFSHITSETRRCLKGHKVISLTAAGAIRIIVSMHET